MGGNISLTRYEEDDLKLRIKKFWSMSSDDFIRILGSDMTDRQKALIMETYGSGIWLDRDISSRVTVKAGIIIIMEQFIRENSDKDLLGLLKSSVESKAGTNIAEEFITSIERVKKELGAESADTKDKDQRLELIINRVMGSTVPLMESLQTDNLRGKLRVFKDKKEILDICPELKSSAGDISITEDQFNSLFDLLKAGEERFSDDIIKQLMYTE